MPKRFNSGMKMLEPIPEIHWQNLEDAYEKALSTADGDKNAAALLLISYQIGSLEDVLKALSDRRPQPLE